jgi:hypothetical protein
MVFDPSGGDRLVAAVCLTLIMPKPRLTSPSSGVVWQVAYHRLHGFLDLG